MPRNDTEYPRERTEAPETALNDAIAELEARIDLDRNWYNAPHITYKMIEAARILEDINPGRGTEYLDELQNPNTRFQGRNDPTMVYKEMTENYNFVDAEPPDAHWLRCQYEAKWAQAMLEHSGVDHPDRDTAQRIIAGQLEHQKIFDPDFNQFDDMPGPELRNKLAHDFRQSLTGWDHPNNPAHRYAEHLLAGNTEAATPEWSNMLRVMEAITPYSSPAVWPESICNFTDKIAAAEQGQLDSASPPRLADFSLEQLRTELEQNQAAHPAHADLRNLLYQTVERNLTPGGDLELAQQAYTPAKSTEQPSPTGTP